MSESPMETTTLILLPFEQADGPSSTWQIARIRYPSRDVRPLLDALSPGAGGLGYFPYNLAQGRAVGLLHLDRHFPGWMDVVRKFVPDPASVEIVPHEGYDASWRLPPDPFPIGANLRVASTSSAGRAPGDIVLDPGLAFGDFQHPTTTLSADAMMEVARPESSLIDVGCGSGILFLVAARLGLKSLAATEINPYARFVAERNAALNGVEIPITYDSPDARFDIVVANVWARAYPAIAAPLYDLVAEGGRLIVSGFQPSDVAAIEPCFPEMRLECRELHAWCALVGTRA